VLLFFSVTGITLNHADWFSGVQSSTDAEGTLDVRWVRAREETLPDADLLAGVDRLQVVEHLRKTHGIRGALAGFIADERECVVTFKGPGYSADAFIDRGSGSYRLNQTSQGFVAVMNDFHKGRDTGSRWSAVIDVSAGLLTFASLSGLTLLFYIKRRRAAGLAVALVATLAVVAVMVWLAP
jgi:hypothetical protein